MFFSAFHTQHYAAKLASIRARLEFAPQVNMLTRPRLARRRFSGPAPCPQAGLPPHEGFLSPEARGKLSSKQILAWADAHFVAHGKWPTAKSGPIAGTRET